MKSTLIRSATCLASAFALGASLSAQTPAPAQAPAAPKGPPAPQLTVPAASPVSTLKQRVGLTDIEIVYARPGAKGRTMIGKVEPYGAVWRTGANNATTITFSTDVKLGGQPVPAGKYALFTIPTEKDWTVIINKGSAQWGAFAYKQEDDLVRFNVTPVKLNDHVETFEIGINDIRDGSATINLSWEKVRVPIKLEIDLNPIFAKIDEVMAGEGVRPNTYSQAAGFYLDHGRDLTKALKWIEASVAAGANQTNVHLKAKILAKMGNKDAAIAAAKQSIELASKSTNAGIRTEYTKLNENLIASLK
jgi:hypothetical protein